MELTVRCRSHERDYEIRIDRGVRRHAAAFPGRKLRVRDPNVPATPELPDVEHVLTPGEEFKTFAAVVEICRTAAQNHFTRSDRFVALGGGVTGDLTGFAAAVYMRGVNFIQIPTTLLAMVDASVGGKTAADLPEGKNLIGAFHQPEAVLIDPGFLVSLPKSELANGLAEVVKIAVIRDAELFEQLERAGTALIEQPDFDGLYPELIRRCCELKAAVVESDEHEHGLRAILNYGHTFGHAVEQLSGFTVPHGAGVAVGMSVAANLNVRLGRWSAADARRQTALLAALGLPTAIPRQMAAASVLNAMRGDKKCDRSGLRLVLPGDRVGTAETLSGIPEKLILETLEESYDRP